MEPAGIAPEPPDDSLEQLMVGYQQADPAAAEALIDLLTPRFHRFFSSQMGNQTDADDMLQEFWLRIHRVRHTYRPGQPLLPWAYAIAHRVRIDSFRRRKRRSREVTVDAVLERAVAPGNPLDAPGFDRLLATLPERQREVLTMLNVEGLSVAEIARATSSTAGAVKQKAHRAYERLRKLLAELAAIRPDRKGAAK